MQLKMNERGTGQPNQPAYPLREVGTLPTPEWGTIATYELESLSLSSKIIRIGEHLLFDLRIW